ncbi:substrate-binding domain-containing protein [Pseudomonas chlororaphis]|uniref:Arabinose ABC transporter substrate-binding protein n=1 Tax=Pseudomonas chlororaphis TaxID=587753 RepID=A0A0D5Y2V6_9PSED|nr:substrate-binding domain-containing protein [Pseudomonas chlororaphis]AKA25668.1 arabinose ABC transporter substrate-binding protein [Pseudomonas chlororaphis]
MSAHRLSVGFTLRALGCAAALFAASALSSLAGAEEVKIGFLVKQAEEPWFQTEWAFAEKAGKDKGFTVIKIAVPDGEKTLAAIDTLAANGAKGFVICPPDTSLGPAIMAKARLNGLKVLAVDDRFVDAHGQPMEDVPYVGLAAFKIGQKQGLAMVEEAKRRGWDLSATYAVINTFDELDTGKKRTDGSVDSLKAAGLPADHILFTAQKTLDVPGSMDATNSALVKLPGTATHLLIGGMNDSAVLGGVRATESAGFKAANVIGVGINGTDAIGELKKADSGFFGSMLLSPDTSGYETARQMFEWVTTGKEPAKYTALDNVTLITRANFQQELTRIGLWK